MKLLNQYFKGWGFNVQGKIKNKRIKLQEELFTLEDIEESVGLTCEQMNRKVQVLYENFKLIEQEKLYLFGRSHETWLLKGDINT